MGVGVHEVLDFAFLEHPFDFGSEGCGGGVFFGLDFILRFGSEHFFPDVGMALRPGTSLP